MTGIGRGTSTVSGYLVLPPDGAGPALVVLQEWWGLVKQIQGVADRLAAAGYVVFVPDLYEGAIASEPGAAERLMMGLQLEETIEKLGVVCDGLLSRSDVTSEVVACVGFCMGGGLALYWPTREARVGASVVYYGAIPWADVSFDCSSTRASFLLHYAELDEWARPELGRAAAEALEQAGCTALLTIYEGARHAFCDETRPESYDADACELAFARTLSFLAGVFDAPREEENP